MWVFFIPTFSRLDSDTVPKVASVIPAATWKIKAERLSSLRTSCYDRRVAIEGKKGKVTMNTAHY